MSIPENDVIVQAVKTFQGDEGFKTPASAPFQISRQRFADLAANGLVVEVDDAQAEAEQKAAPKPSNKAAAKPDNK